MTSSARCHQCGTRLARDNPGSVCGPCAITRASTCEVSAPVPPPSLWDRDDVHAALRDGHIGRLFRAFRHAHTPPITQEQLAEWVQLTQGQISIIERQRRPITDLERLERWCDALHVPARLRWFSGPAPSRQSGEHPSTSSEDESHRLRRALDDPSRVDLVAVALLRQQVQDLEERYDTLPSTALLPEAGRLHAQTEALTQHASGRIAKELRLVLSETATMLGQLTWDASQRRDHATSLTYLDQAIRAADDIADPTAQGYALLRKAYVALYGQRDPHAGLALTRHVGEISAASSDVLAGLAHLHAAEAHAMLPDARACETALSRAETHFSRIAPSDIAAHLYSPDQFDRLAGSCYLSLGDHTRAQRTLDNAARTQSVRSKSRALVLANLSLSHLQQRDVEAATLMLHRALDIVEVTRGGGALNLVARVGRELRPWRAHSAVELAYDRVVSLLTAA